MGFKFTGKGAPARGGSVVKTASGDVVGEITSGGFSPVLGENIAMGYVQKAHAKAGTELLVETMTASDAGGDDEDALRHLPLPQTGVSSRVTRHV